MTRLLNIIDPVCDDIAAFIPGEITTSVSAMVSNARSVTIQLYDAAGQKPTEVQMVHIWLSDSATDLSVTGTTPAGTTGPTTGTLVAALTTKINERVLTDATGCIVFLITNNTTSHGWYLNVKWAGIVRTSTIITVSA
jgi:hypothetical protein